MSSQRRASLESAAAAFCRAYGPLAGWQAMEVALEVYVDQSRKRRSRVPVEAMAMFRALLSEHGMSRADLIQKRLPDHQQLVLDEALLVMRSWPVSLHVLGEMAHRDHSSVHTALGRARTRMAGDEVMRLRVARLSVRVAPVGEREAA